MKNAQKPEKVALGSLLHQLKDGRFVIPDFQREFEWRPWDIRDLLKSMLLDYYIGTLLLWKGTGENFENLSCEPVYGHSGEEKPEYIVLDGQQRLTAIYYAFHGPNLNFPNRTRPVVFFARLDKLRDENYDECVDYDFVSKKWLRKKSTPEYQYENHIFPFTLLGKGTREVIRWLDGYGYYWKDKSKEYAAAGDESNADLARQAADFKTIFDKEVEELERDYQISYIELDKDIPVEKVCDIFTQINSKGIRLDIFDLLNAMLKPKGIQLKQMWRSASSRLEFVGTPKMNVYVLQVMSILNQAYCSAKYLYYLIPGQPKVVRDPDGSKRQITLVETKSDFEYHWDQSIEALELAISALRNPRDYGAINPSFIPYPSIVPVFAAIRRYARQNGLLSRLDVNQKIRKWYWASVFTNRYSSSVESTSAQDFLAMRRWFDDDALVPTPIQEFENGFRNLDLVNENKKGTAIYNALLNLLIIKGAKDLGTFQFPEYDDLDDHHIVPSSWGRQHVGGEIHSILNKTPLSAATNRHLLSNKLPNVYLKDLFDKNEESDVRGILRSHYISREATEILLREDFSADDYREFLAARQKSMVEGIEDLLINDQVDTSMPLVNLNDAIERVELELRAHIARALDEDPSKLPGAVKEKAGQRIEGVLRRDATKSQASFQSIQAILQFADLRELEATIINGKLWAEFEPLFGQKSVLQKRFSQLAELRNCLRHSRSVDDVVKMEGEAAVVWFERLLSQKA
jgi:hypothetical protein